MPRAAIPFVCLALSLPACGPGPAIVPPPPPNSAVPTTTSTATTVAIAKPPPSNAPPLEVAAAPPLTIPPAPPIPPRTCPTLPNVAPESMGPRSGKAVIVNVFDYLSLAPIAGVNINVTHFETCTRHGGCKPSHPHPANLLRIATKTNNQGRVTLNVPDLDYRMEIPTTHKSPGYLMYSSIYDLGKQKCHELLIEKRSADDRIVVFDAYLIPESMRAIQNQDQALDAAKQNADFLKWLGNHQDANLTIRDKISVWDVGAGYDNRFSRLVQVNAFDGSTHMLGKWGD